MTTVLTAPPVTNINVSMSAVANQKVKSFGSQRVLLSDAPTPFIFRKANSGSVMILHPPALEVYNGHAYPRGEQAEHLSLYFNNNKEAVQNLTLQELASFVHSQFAPRYVKERETKEKYEALQTARQKAQTDFQSKYVSVPNGLPTKYLDEKYRSHLIQAHRSADQVDCSLARKLSLTFLQAFIYPSNMKVLLIR